MKTKEIIIAMGFIIIIGLFYITLNALNEINSRQKTLTNESLFPIINEKVIIQNKMFTKKDFKKIVETSVQYISKNENAQKILGIKQIDNIQKEELTNILNNPLDTIQQKNINTSLELIIGEAIKNLDNEDKYLLREMLKIIRENKYCLEFKINLKEKARKFIQENK